MSLTLAPREAPARTEDAAPPAGRLVSARVIRLGGWSVRVDARACAVSGLLLAGIVAVGCWSISVGDFPIPIGDVVRELLGEGSDDSRFIVESIRLPRVITGVLVGASFAVSGAIFQSLAQNPLASPDVVGFNAGAALGAVSTIVLVEGPSTMQVSMGALAGGFATALVVYVCAYRRGVLGYRLILVGIGVAFAVMAGTDYLMTRARIDDVQRAAVWLTGSLNNRTWEHVRPLSIGLLVLVVPTFVLGRQLRLLELGSDAAAALGARVGAARLGLLLVGVGFAALATAAAGPVAFVALLSPPITRRIVGSPGALLVPTALFGALLVVSADLIARRVLAPTELPVGIATAVLGAPYLLWLLTREIRAGAM